LIPISASRARAGAVVEAVAGDVLAINVALYRGFSGYSESMKR